MRLIDSFVACGSRYVANWSNLSISFPLHSSHDLWMYGSLCGQSIPYLSMLFYRNGKCPLIMQCLQTARIQLIIVIFSQHLSDKYEVGYLRCSKIFITAGYAMTHTFVVVVKVGRATVSVAV